MERNRLVRWLERISRPPSSNLCHGFPVEKALCLMLTVSVNPRILDVGAGDRTIHDKVVRMDIHGDRNVDIIGDACSLPIRSESLDGIFMISVMQYVERPFDVASEFYRVLKPGGYVYANAPFIYPFVEDSDKFRFTVSGINLLFSRFERIDAGFSRGPSSIMVPILANYWATVLSFNSDTICKLLVRLFSWVFFPMKYIDLVIGKYSDAKVVCSAVYFVGRKAP